MTMWNAKGVALSEKATENYQPVPTPRISSTAGLYYKANSTYSGSLSVIWLH